MDARQKLRQYLEQRREMGETELVLDQMSVEEALRILGGAGTAAAAPPPAFAEPDGGEQMPGARYQVPGDSDWRAALRATGVGPQSTAPKPRNAAEAPPPGIEHAAPEPPMSTEEDPS